MAPGLDEFDVLLEVVLSLVRVMYVLQDRDRNNGGREKISPKSDTKTFLLNTNLLFAKQFVNLLNEVGVGEAMGRVQNFITGYIRASS